MNEGTHSFAQNLPPEIIIEIVLEIFEAQSDVAWTVASVCRSWRFATLNVTGRLWSRICIPVGTIPHALERRTLPNKRIETWLPTTPLYLDLRENSPLISNAFSDALSYGGHGEGGGNAFEHYFKGAMVDADTRSKPTGPMVDGPRGKGAGFVFLSVALQGLFGYSSFRRPRLNYASALCQRTVRRAATPSNRPPCDWVMPPSSVYCALSLDSHHVPKETGHCAASEDTLLKCAWHRLLSSWLLSSAPNMSHVPSIRSVLDSSIWSLRASILFCITMVLP